MTPDSQARLIAQIKPEEGCVLHAYPDSRGFTTIGWGRMIDQRMGGGISQSEADYLFANDISTRLAQLQQYQWYSIQDEVRQAALADMDFNTDLLHWPHFLGFMLVKDYPNAVGQLVGTPWYNELGPRALRIENEIATGEWS
jgi:lysozyme